MWKIVSAAAVILTLACAPRAEAQAPSIADFTRDIQFSSPSLSPDGRYVAGILHAPGADQLVRHDWRSGETAILVTAAEANDEHLEWVRWKNNNRLLLGARGVLRVRDSRESGTHVSMAREAGEYDIHRVLAVNADGSNRVQMFEGQQRRLAVGTASTALVNILPNDAQNVLITAYGSDGLGLWRANVETGRVQQVESEGWDNGRGWGTDRDGNAVLRYESFPGRSGYRVLRRAPGAQNWIEAFTVRATNPGDWDEFLTYGPGPAPGQMWVATRVGAEDRSGVYLYDTATGEFGEARYRHATADAGVIWLRKSGDISAACAVTTRTECEYIDAEIGRHIRAINRFFENSVDVERLAASDDENIWLIGASGPTLPRSYFIYDRTAASVRIIGSTASLSPDVLSPTEVVTYTSRDGAPLWGYITMPRNAPASGAPLIVLPHGGPVSRDVYEFDALTQFLASRGYVVFQPNFRGGGGFGLAFEAEGFHQWGLRMQDDVTDGVQHLIQSGRVDANRVCIAGISYGGYAALAGASLTPDLYRCAISIAGVSDLMGMLRFERAEAGRRSMALDYWQRRIGNMDSDRAAIDAASPINHVDAIHVPILLIHGDDDSIVPVSQSRDMDAALRAAGKAVRYVHVPEANHPYIDWESPDRLLMFREIESFLAANNPAR